MTLAAFSLAWVLWTLAILMGDCRQQRAALAAPAPAAAVLPCTAATFEEALPSYASVERVDRVPAGGVYGEGSADLGFPENVTGLPALCAVTVRVQNGSSDHRFGLFLPATAATWNGRFLAVGSYSFAGGINWPDMGAGPHYGFATLGSDGGHNSTQDALDWAPTTPAKLADWGHRALHEAVVVGKRLTRVFYGGSPIHYAYFSGCSTGGRQGLKEVQMNPDSFDGVLAGAPAWDTARLMSWLTRIGAANLPEDAPSHLDLPQFAVLAAAARAQCDGLDGHLDGIISRPELCALNLTALRCESESEAGLEPDSSRCLTDAQIDAARNLYADAYTAAGDFIHSGHTVGSEDQWYVYLSFGAAADFDTRFERFWLYNDSTWAWPQYSDATFYDAVHADPGRASADALAAIAPFRDRGGKLLMYQGLADGVVPPRSTLLYYESTRQALGLSVADQRAFFRYFPVPGMQHCFFTPPAVQAPWMFAAPGQAPLLRASFGFGPGWGVPGLPPSPRHDALLALVAWVEHGTAPDRIVATTWKVDGTGTVKRTRPLCAYPQHAVYEGGPEDEANSWVCR